MVWALARESEAQGTDAAGIAYNSGGTLHITGRDRVYPRKSGIGDPSASNVTISLQKDRETEIVSRLCYNGAEMIRKGAVCNAVYG